MSPSSVVAACVFAAVLGAVMACIDRWRDARLIPARTARRVRVAVAPVPAVPAARGRAA
jgi:hypothetical protein